MKMTIGTSSRLSMWSFLPCALLLFVAAIAWANPVLAPPLADHMVLQQGREIYIWGWADQGEKVTVSFNGKQATSTADGHRQWGVWLPAMHAGGPYALTVQGKQTIIVRDVLIGEVWVASGQSNMTYALSGATGAAEELKKADYPEMRLFTVPRRISLVPQAEMAASSWQICTAETARGFSAVAYTFARDLHRKLGVPVGIIQSAWPGTPIEEWMPAVAFLSDPTLQAVFAKWNTQSTEVKQYAQRPLDFALEFKDFELLRADSQRGTPIFSNSFYEKRPSKAVSLHWVYDWVGGPETYFELSRQETEPVVRIRGQLDNTGASMLTGRWSPGNSPTNLSGYTGIRFKVRGSGGFRMRFLQPSISDWDDYASAYVFATADWEPVTISFRDLHQEGWGVAQELTPEAFTGIVIESVTKLGYPDRPPAGLFNGMIAPLTHFPVRGAIWYQGESNALSAQLYRKELPAMISGWREAWKRDDMSFLIVQLPNHGAIPESPSESAWAELREAQLKTVQSLDGTGLAVTIDIGEPKNVHPSRKIEVGERLALWALANPYMQSVVYSGPLFEFAEVKGEKIRVRFRNVGGGLFARGGGAFEGFAVAGSDRRFHWANASVEGNEIIVSSPDVPTPVAVRYAWADSPKCNLINKEGLPASPFRTDNWPGITAGTVDSH